MAAISVASAEYRGNKLLVFTAIFMPVQIICVSLRLLARNLKGALGWDDLVILASLACQLGTGGAAIDKSFRHTVDILMVLLIMLKVAFTRWPSLPNILSDVVMLILPMPTIWNLHLKPQLKIGLIITILAGSL
ncbi:hypothetical protein P7C71_g3843, partial [Lecanoromycetidae sp. Uapishka_2]